MRFLPLRSVVEHPARLAILACLDRQSPQTMVQVRIATRLDEKVLAYHMKTLDTFGLVQQKGSTDDGEPLYVGRLRRQGSRR